jgi:predicted anti-sigma-YlaC factor YlaD
MHAVRSLLAPAAAALAAATLLSCSLKKLAINQVGNTLASGTSVYQTDDDVELIGDALPFSLKLVEGLLTESPRHSGLLVTACRGYVTYSYGWVQHEADVEASEDVERSRALRARARRLYLRGLEYGLRGLELDTPGFGAALARDPDAAVRAVEMGQGGRNVPLLYWSAAALGLAVSTAKSDAQMLARLPEVDALIERALELDEDWDRGTLHEFGIVLEGARPGAPDEADIVRHHERALQLSKGTRAAPHVARAEALALPRQDRASFRRLLEAALAVDPDADPENRLANVIAQRRARWLLGRIDELFLEGEGHDGRMEGTGAGGSS